MFTEECLNKLLDFGKEITSTVDLDELGNITANSLVKVFQARRVSLMLLDKDKRDLYMWAFSDGRSQLSDVRVGWGQMFAGWVAKEGHPLLVRDVDSEYPSFSKTKDGRYQSKSFIISPLKIKDNTIGVVNLTERQEPEVFSEEDVELLSSMNIMTALQIERVRLLFQVENLCITDCLTNVFNHRHFQECLDQEIDRVQRYRHPCSLIILDIDNFHQYNETHGYAMGDSILVEMAGLITDNVRKVDVVARFGGEEFAVILPDTNRKQAGVAAEKLREKIADAVFVEKRNSSLGMVRLTVSAGVAEYNIRETKEEFIQRVKNALLEAKQKGKNKVVVF